MERRSFNRALAALAAVPLAGAGRSGAADTVQHGHDMSHTPPDWKGQEHIALLAYPQFTLLDLVGPQYMFANLMGATVHIVAKTREPVMSDTRVAIVPTTTFDDCPRDLDILCVPGGTVGTLAAMQDTDTLAFLADRGGRARFVTSVCTGSLVLGAAGLLRGYEATSHWVTVDILSILGAKPSRARVVFDRSRVTGAGVTAGLDFGLALVEQLRGVEYAKAVQLLAEYAPAPPLDAGTPAQAGPEITKLLADMFVGFVAEARAIAEKSAAAAGS
jgi:putative intracellular protease/amidase